jgi:Zn-dependent protease with chaperone function
VSLFLYWLSLPARLIGRAIAGGVKHRLLSLPVKLTLGFFTLGMFLPGYFTGFGLYTVLMLSPWAAPLVVPWLSRKAEHYADRVAADLGFGVPLAEVFAGREFERARSAWRPERPGLDATQPLDTARLRALEKHLSRTPEGVHQSPWPAGPDRA